MTALAPSAVSTAADTAVADTAVADTAAADTAVSTGLDTDPGAAALGLADALRPLLTGALHLPGDEGYDALATPWNVAVPMRPTAVVAPGTADDVAATVRVAGALGLTVGVQSTGHGAHPSLAGDVLVATRHLDELEIHPEERWARIGAGVKWGAVLTAAGRHGLMPLMGSATDVGVVGYLTGGGVGPMVRTFGLSSDLVRAFDVVTGDGVLRRVTPTEHPDLFFGLRGGKGALGLVTAVEVDLLPVTAFLGGGLYFDGDDAATVLDVWRRWSVDLPEEATTSVVLLRLPDAPFVPPPLAGRLTVGVRFAWTGEEALGAACLAPMRAAAPVLLDDVTVKPTVALDSVHADPVDPMPVHDASMLLGDLPVEALDTLLALAGPGSGSPQVMVELRAVGGALARPGAHPSAFDHRAAGYSVLAVGIAFDPAVPGHAAALLTALEPWGTGGVWPNMCAVHDAASAARAYGAGTLERLRATAVALDPAGTLAAGAFLRAPVDGPSPA